MTILPSVYYGTVEYWAELVQGGSDVVIDLGENYVKRSERNRTEIMTSGGIMQLSVQLVQANRPRQPMRTMKIDYSKRWPFYGSTRFDGKTCFYSIFMDFINRSLYIFTSF